jgi:hypothetical protein
MTKLNGDFTLPDTTIRLGGVLMNKKLTFFLLFLVPIFFFQNSVYAEEFSVKIYTQGDEPFIVYDFTVEQGDKKIAVWYGEKPISIKFEEIKHIRFTGGDSWNAGEILFRNGKKQAYPRIWAFYLGGYIKKNGVSQPWGYNKKDLKKIEFLTNGFESAAISPKNSAEAIVDYKDDNN